MSMDWGDTNSKEGALAYLLLNAQKIDPEFKKKWVEALRSGDYHQIQGNLKLINDKTDFCGHCCLGVLCEINNLSQEVTSKNVLINSVAGYHEVSFDGSSAFVPNTLASKIGLTTPVQNSLSTINDCGGYDFKKIADVIEETL